LACPIAGTRPTASGASGGARERRHSNNWPSFIIGGQGSTPSWGDVRGFPRSEPPHHVPVAPPRLAACVIVQSLGTLAMIHWVCPGPSGLRIPERGSPRRAPPRPLHVHRPPPSDPDRSLGRRVLASRRAFDAREGSLLLHHHLHDGRLRRCRPRPWLAGTRRDRGPHGHHPGRLVDGVRVRDREPYVRALATGARGVLMACMPRGPRVGAGYGRSSWSRRAARGDAGLRRWSTLNGNVGHAARSKLPAAPRRRRS